MKYIAIATLNFLLFQTPSLVHGQKAEKINTLKVELANATEDTSRMRLMLSLSMTYQGFQTDSAMAYALSSLHESEALNYPKGRADALLQLARLKRDQGDVTEALDEMFVALKLYREINDNVQVGNALNDISIIYANSGDYENSLNYFKQALEIFKRTNDEKGESYALNNIGIIYQDMGNLEMAKDYFTQSLTIKQKNHDLYGISRGYTNLGAVAEKGQDWVSALRYYLKGDSLFTVTNDKQAQAINFVAIARIKEKQDKLKEARRYALMALEKGEEVKSLTTMLSASKLLADFEEKNDNYKTSLMYQKLYNQIADSLNNENHQAKLEELKARFNLEDKEREIEILRKDKELQAALMRGRNILTYSLSGGILFLTIISGLIYYAYRTTKNTRDNLAVKNKEIEQQRDDLDKLNKEKDRFFSILSHDLRAPLGSLKGLSHLILTHGDVLTPAESETIKHKIDTSLDNLTNLINNILEWSVTSSKKRKWTFSKVSPTELIQKNISLYKDIAESKSVSLVFKGDDEAFAYADYQAIDTVIRNLLSNSIKFSHPDSEITITTRKGDDSIQISVKDQGIGIPLDIQKNLFTLKGNVNQAGTKNEKGAGIGLTLCKELMLENNGNIEVKSKPGEGSEFVVSLPQFES
ncbi:MAG TPA: tetratricopeptide repeat-containing sensor histidine kinase [Cyclobacteriaceae bacterium]|nr:tetratricopeptide repeat-containing sensor histidine kinase [Cyclobacteriaceae bacterium]